MPSWKKVIVSGSDATLNSLIVSNGITGSLQGTSSFATNALSASFALTASNSQNAQDILIYVKNVSGAQIDKGTVVRISGATGDNALISTASYESDGVSANTLGITNQNIPNDSFGYVMTEGTLLGINTNAFSAGQLLYLGASGSIIGTAPVAPLHSVRLGQVLRVQLNNGSMYVRIDNGYELGELHDVVDTTTTSSFGDLLIKSGSVWTNSKQLTGSYALTGSLQATSFTGSLQGTASFAVSASRALNANQASTISISGISTNADYSFPLILTGSSGASVGLNNDTVSGFSYNPSNNLFKIFNLSATGSLLGTSSFASTASFVDTLNQNVLITGSATVGSTSAGASENTLTLGARDAGSEGGQLGLNAPGGTYTSASMIDNYANSFRILKGNNTTSTGLVAQWNLHTTQLQLPAYTSTSAFSGTVVGILGFDSSGNILTTTASAGGGGGSGTVNSGTSGYIAYYPSTGTTVDDTSGVYWDSGNSRLAVGNSSPSYKLDVSGDIRATGAIYANANGAMYFQGGDDAALYDVNVANTMGVYGQQDSTIGSIKLGSGGGVISGYNSNIGIGTTSPAYKLDVSGTFRSTGDTILANASNVIIKNASNYPVFEGQSSSAQIGFSRSGTTDITYIGSDSSYLFRLWDESFGATYFNILQNGNTGIGTASPSTKLHLSGTTTILTITDTTYSRTSQIGYVDSANLYLANDSNSNTYIGAYNNVFLGYGGGNIGIGTTSPAYRLSIVGKIALNDGGNSIFIGDNAGSLDDASANINVGIGQNALQNNITGNQNVAIGNNSLPANNQSNNTAVGSNTMQFNTSGFSCTGIGSYALNANSVGTFNTAVGTAAMITNTSGSSNTAIGSSAQRLAVSGSNNVSLGSTTLYSNLNGNDNVAIGNSSGRYYSTGTAAVTDTSGSIFIGRLARAAADSQVNQIVIGMDALGLGSNTVVLGNDNIVTTALKGNVAIGKTSPNTKLDVNGNTLITGSLRVTAGITGSLNGNADTATSAGSATNVTWTDSAAGSYSIATSDGTTAYYDAAGDARWDGSAKVLSVNTGAGEQLNFNGKYIEQTGTGLLNYYADRHVFGDNAYNYQGQLIGGSFDAAQDITCGGTKYFDIPHQSKPGWGLKHGAIEGPESAVYFRGKLNGSNVIEFPAYWEWLVHSDSITVSLTSIGSFQPLYVAKIENNQAVIASNDQPINCHFVVYGERKDVERWDVEYPGYSRGQIADTE